MKQFAEYNFNDFISNKENQIPDVRIMEFITIGPFVLKTYGSFEYEHMYARDKLLNEDYLKEDGGEKNALPEIGKMQKNIYYGPEYLQWQKGLIKWNCLRFDSEGADCNEALFVTEQRNGVVYAGFYVDCDKESKAVISYVNSGSSLFLNGELVDFKPYGRVKGLSNMGYSCPVTFKKGRNVVLFKLRPGYIADTMDLSMEKCAIYPVICEADGVCVTSCTKTLAYTGSKEEPRMVFPFFAFAEKDVSGAYIDSSFGKTIIPDMKAGECCICRACVPASDKAETIKHTISLHNGSAESGAELYFDTIPYDGFDGEEYIMSDFHFDTTYHQEQRTYALGAIHITKCIIENLERNPDFKAVLSEVDYLHPYYTLYPHHRKALKEAFETGRAEADCFYNQANDLTSSGEAFVRNLVYGQLYHRDVLGRKCYMYVPGDVFGHFSQISQVCAKGGVDSMRWGKCMMGVDNLFRHMSPDGTIMIHDKGIGRGDANRFGVKGCQHSGQALSYVEGYPRTGDTSWMKETISHAKPAVFSELSEKLIEGDRNLIASGKEHNIDYTSRDLTQHHSGVLLTRTDFKQANRLCENLLVTAEKFASVAFMYGAKYPEDALDKAWRQLLTAQHHDSITGTNNEISFVDLMIEYRECAILAADIVEKSTKYIASLIKAERKDNAVCIFNPVAKDVSGPCYFDIPENFKGKDICLIDTQGRKHNVNIINGKAVIYTGLIPAMGYSLYRIEECVAEKSEKSKDNIIENNRFRLETDPVHGGIISIFDKKENKEYIDKNAKCSGNALYVMREIHDRMETQHEIYTTGQKLVSDEFDAVTECEKCDDYEKLTIRNKLDVIATVIREITLYRDSDTIDFKTTVEDYNGEDDLFTVAFPVDIQGSAVIYDDRFAPHVSTRSKKYMSFQTHQYASFSGCRVLPSNRWFGVGPTVTIELDKDNSLNLGMTAIIRKNTDRLCDCSKNLLMALSKKAVPVTIYPDTEQHGGMKIIHYNEDIYETDTRFVLSVKADPDMYTEKLLSLMEEKDRKAIDEKTAKDGIAYIYIKDSDNIYNKPVDTIMAIGKDENALDAFIGKLADSLSKSYTFSLENCIMISKCGLSEKFGAEIINNGTIACSVEGKNTLNMMLFHTASFYGNAGKTTGGKELVPEDKTHIFNYQFYPHKYSYREADTYTKADMFNKPLFAVCDIEERKDAFLEDNKFFLRAGDGFEVTAFKAFGYPLASMKDDTSECRKRGFCVRGYETTGIGHKADIQFGFDISDAKHTDLLEENSEPANMNGNTIYGDIGAYSIETYTLNPVNCGEVNGTILGMENELTEPIFVRSWEHDMGAVAMGYLKFAATIDRKPASENENVTVVNINAVNNSKEKSVSVDLKISCSEGITAEMESVRTEIGPEGCQVIPVTVTRDSTHREGQVILDYTFEGRAFTDVFEFGYFNPEVQVDIEGNKVVCKVSNKTDQYLRGSLYLCSPFETWGMEGSFASLTPFCHEVNMKPGSTETYESEINITDKSEYIKAYYVVAKLCCNGRIHFGYAGVHGPRHNQWAHEFIDEIIRDRGSIKKLLEM